MRILFNVSIWPAPPLSVGALLFSKHILPPNGDTEAFMVRKYKDMLISGKIRDGLGQSEKYCRYFAK